MNKQRRLSLRNAVDILLSAKCIVEKCESEEQDSLDNIPDNLQDSDTACNMNDAIDFMSDALDSIDDAIDCINNAVT